MRNQYWIVWATILVTACDNGSNGTGATDAGSGDAGSPTCMKVRVLDTRFNVPAKSSVAAVLGVESCTGDPVVGLGLNDFTLYEDDSPVSKTESQAVVLQRPAESYVSLVMDSSKSVADSGSLQKAADAASSFAQKVMPEPQLGQVWVAVYFFSESLEPVQEFTNDRALVLSAIESFVTNPKVSNTTNLYGAVVDAVSKSTASQVARRGAMNGGVFTMGQIAVFTDGTDTSAIKTLADALSAVNSTADDVVTIALGGEVDQDVLGQLGKNGSYAATNPGELISAFDTAASRLSARQNRLYIIGYCSPKRAGSHNLVVSVASVAAKSGPIPFSADDFVGGECSALAFDRACEGKSCGGLLCGGCSHLQVCDASDQCM